MSKSSFVLKLSCANRPGIVAAFSRALFDASCNITEAQQFDDAASGSFFSRVTFEPNAANHPEGVSHLRTKIEEALKPFDASWDIRNRAHRRRVIVLVSKSDHCLADILYRWKIGELEMDLVGVISTIQGKVIQI